MLEYGHTASMKCKPDGKLRSQQYSYVALHSFKRSILESYCLCVSAPHGKSAISNGGVPCLLEPPLMPSKLYQRLRRRLMILFRRAPALGVS